MGAVPIDTSQVRRKMNVKKTILTFGIRSDFENFFNTETPPTPEEDKKKERKKKRPV